MGRNELDKYLEAKKSTDTHLQYINELLKKKIQEKESDEAISHTVARIQLVRDTIKNDKDLEKTNNKPIQYSNDEKLQSVVSLAPPIEPHGIENNLSPNF